MLLILDPHTTRDTSVVQCLYHGDLLNTERRKRADKRRKTAPQEGEETAEEEQER